VYKALRDKVDNEWRTRISARADGEGRVKLEGFKGAYEISCNGKTDLFVLDGKNDSLEIKLT
jgi:hypothetical protein